MTLIEVEFVDGDNTAKRGTFEALPVWTYDS